MNIEMLILGKTNCLTSQPLNDLNGSKEPSISTITKGTEHWNNI